MLPGFRFVLASVLLSVSLVIFGLGAAGLLRTAHEKFANIPIRRPDPALMVPPALAMLRVDAPEQDSSREPVLRNAPVAVPEVAPVLQAALANTLTDSDITGPVTSDPVSKARAEAMSGIAPVIAPPPVIAPVETIPAASAEVAAVAPAPELSAPPASVPVATLPAPVPARPAIEGPADKTPEIAAVPVPEAPVAPVATPDAAMIAAPAAAVPEIIASFDALIAAGDVPLPRHRPASAMARKSEEPAASETAAAETPAATATAALEPSAPPVPDVASTGSIAVAMIALPEVTADANALIAAGDVKLPRERPTPTAGQTGEVAKKTKTVRRKSRSQRIVEQQPPPPPPQPQTYRAEVLSFR